MDKLNKQIIKDVIDGKSSKENAHNVVDWLASTIEGQLALSEMIDHDAYILEDTLINENRVSEVQTQKVFEKINAEINKNRFKIILGRVAAVLIPFVLVFSLGVYLNNYFDIVGNVEYSELYIPNGEKARVIFQDGSEAILNSSSKITFPKKFGLLRREVVLDGEAYFNVDNNKFRPFLVKTGQSVVKVLGTSFNVSSYSDDDLINVTLDNGIVEFITDNNKYQLSPGQQLTFDKKNKGYSVINLSNSERNSLWTSDILYFNDTPMSQVIKILERKYDAKFKIEDKGVLDYSFTLTTKIEDISHILSELEMIAPVRFIIKENTYVVTLP